MAVCSAALEAAEVKVAPPLLELATHGPAEVVANV
jgi:hypothetical protein